MRRTHDADLYLHALPGVIHPGVIYRAASAVRLVPPTPPHRGSQETAEVCV
jgi:hypothetical protein